MSDPGEVARAIVIRVMRSHGVTVTSQEDGPEGMMILAKGDKLEAKKIPQKCGRKLLHYLSRNYGVPVHIFYNPDEVLISKQDSTGEDKEVTQ